MICLIVGMIMALGFILQYMDTKVVYANTIIDHGQDRILELHTDIKDRDNVILSQLDYYVSLQSVLKEYDIDYLYYYEYLETRELLNELIRKGTNELKGFK